MKCMCVEPRFPPVPSSIRALECEKPFRVRSCLGFVCDSYSYLLCCVTLFVDDGEIGARLEQCKHRVCDARSLRERLSVNKQSNSLAPQGLYLLSFLPPFPFLTASFFPSSICFSRPPIVPQTSSNLLLASGKLWTRFDRALANPHMRFHPSFTFLALNGFGCGSRWFRWQEASWQGSEPAWSCPYSL
jgi:hypothetical protein